MVRADASWVYVTNKQVMLTVTVTPSPIAFVPSVAPAPVIGRVMKKKAPIILAYDPLRASDMIASTSGTVPVALTVKPDPNYGIFSYRDSHDNIQRRLRTQHLHLLL